MGVKDGSRHRLPPKYRPPAWVVLLVNVAIVLLIFGWAWWEARPKEKAEETPPGEGVHTPEASSANPFPEADWPVPDLIKALQSRDPAVRLAAVHALAKQQPHPPEAFAPLLEALLYDSDAGVRSAADRPVQRYAEFVSIPGLEADRNAPWNTFLGLAALKEDEVYPLVTWRGYVQLLKHGRASLRVRAAGALGELGFKAGVVTAREMADPLGKLQRDREADLKAVLAVRDKDMWREKTEKMVSEIKEALAAAAQDPEESVRRSAATAAAKVVIRPKDD